MVVAKLPCHVTAASKLIQGHVFNLFSLLILASYLKLSFENSVSIKINGIEGSYFGNSMPNERQN